MSDELHWGSLGGVFSVSRGCRGVTSRAFSRREYLGRQLQSTDQQQAPAVAARSWTAPCACVLVYQCVDDCSGCTSVFVILEISCLLCVRTWKSKGAVSSLRLHPKWSPMWLDLTAVLRVVPPHPHPAQWCVVIYVCDIWYLSLTCKHCMCPNKDAYLWCFCEFVLIFR